MADKRNTVVRLSRPVGADGRTVDSLAFDGVPGSEPLPVTERDGEYEIDTLTMLDLMARRTGVSRPTIEKLPAPDLLALGLVLFASGFGQKKKWSR